MSIQTTTIRHEHLNNVIASFNTFSQCVQQCNNISSLQEISKVVGDMKEYYILKEKEYLWREHMGYLLNNATSYVTNFSDLEEVFLLMLSQRENTESHWDYTYKFLQEIHSYCKNYNLEIKDCVRKNYLNS